MHTAKLAHSPLFFIKNEWQLQALWREHAQKLPFLITEDGEKVGVMNTGEHNLRHSGPDFQLAFLKINDTFHYGHIEMHTHPKEWYEHGHHLDDAYNAVICHFSLYPTKTPLYRADGSVLPNIALSQQLFPSQFLSFLMPSTNKKVQQNSSFPCMNLGGVSSIPSLALEKQLLHQLQLRFLGKAEQVLVLLERLKFNWQEVFYSKLLQSFLLPYNQMGAELLAEALPLNRLLKIPITLWEAALLFKAGLIPNPKEQPSPVDDYHSWLFQQASNYRGIIGEPLESSTWNWGGNRPISSVTTKIAAFAAMLEANGSPYNWLENISLSECFDVLSAEIHPYYSHHLSIGGPELAKPLKTELGLAAKELIIINGIIPLQLAIAVHKGRKELGLQECYKKLMELKPESNHAIKSMQTIGFQKPKHAAEGQALLAQYKQLCALKKCQECVAGAAHQLAVLHNNNNNKN